VISIARTQETPIAPCDDAHVTGTVTWTRIESAIWNVILISSERVIGMSARTLIDRWCGTCHDLGKVDRHWLLLMLRLTQQQQTCPSSPR